MPPFHYQEFASDYNRPPVYQPYVPPAQRQSAKKGWPYGVVQGGTVMDMTEYLRTQPTITGTDQALSLWIQGTYLLPFRRIERLDGLIVRNESEMETLVFAYQRYCKVWFLPDGAPPQPLFVPGLEPLKEPTGDWTVVPRIPEVVLSSKFDTAGMYLRGTERVGTLVKTITDDKMWVRNIWHAPLAGGPLVRISVEGSSPSVGPSEHGYEDPQENWETDFGEIEVQVEERFSDEYQNEEGFDSDKEMGDRSRLTISNLPDEDCNDADASAEESDQDEEYEENPTEPWDDEDYEVTRCS
ncbi:hypothetical protein CC78DRAFT_606940 [Lojkania enalia]|uniref:Uncharacterized protein n=1 Tax=Lojkania enalia TaxID=147567 RepID=A0A9P4N9D6_9PLEO|nr:hypothetical protein CC78DRAFT_606940 [Didymosphaeria enalia]